MWPLAMSRRHSRHSRHRSRPWRRAALAGSSYLNLIAMPAERRWSWWGRVIFYVADVDAFHRHALEQGLAPDLAPADAAWGERYFHITDPDGHEISFAMLLA